MTHNLKIVIITFFRRVSIKRKFLDFSNYRERERRDIFLIDNDELFSIFSNIEMFIQVRN